MPKHCLLVLFAMLSVTAFAQRSGGLNANGGRFVGFTIDGDSKTGHTKIYPAATPFAHDDDWFKTPGDVGFGKGIIETSDSASLRARLQAGENISFSKRMIYQPYDIRPWWPTGTPTPPPYLPSTLQFLVDGVYFRDFYANDSSAFTSANKNGQNPNVWTGGFANTGGKCDIIDVFTHVRTSGINPATDSVWFFAGVSTKNVVGARYFDIEVYREPIYYNRTTNGSPANFVSTGTSYGHSRWELNSAGAVTRTGDIIISVEYQSGRAPEIDFRIWVAKSTYDSIQNGRLVPATFKLNGRWDVADDGLHGYAEITADTPTEIWGSGLGNFTGIASADSTYSTPWGTINTGGTWSATYDQLQFVEIGLNFSRFGMNPFQYVTSYCTSPYAAIMVKSRSSPSFSANMDDFVGPVPFTVKDVVPFTVTPQNLTCVRNSSQLLFNFNARNYYKLIAPDGTVLNSNVDFRTAATPADRYLTVTQPGTYTIEATNFQGCPAMSTTTVTVLEDKIPPTAKVLLGWDQPFFFLNGGDVDASNALTPFGRSAGLTWNWTGPNAWTANVEDPRIDTINQGIYNLLLTEARNGCTATSNIFLSSSNFTLPVQAMDLQVGSQKDHNQLTWRSPNRQVPYSYEVQRSSDGLQFHTIGRLATTTSLSLSFKDSDHNSKIWYRIKAVSAQGSALYSNVIAVQRNGSLQAQLTRPGGGDQVLIATKELMPGDAVLVLSTTGGQMVSSKVIRVTNTQELHRVPVPAGLQDKPVLAVLYQGDKVAGSAILR